MKSVVQPFTPFNIPRVAQLSQRSNQCNLRTIRYSEADLQKLMINNQYLTFTYTLEDTFGESGLISVVILKKENADTLFIDTWFMSCRVLKRGMEYFILGTLLESAIAQGFTTLKGQYIPSAKNALVKDFYPSMGFGEKEDYWVLPVTSFNHPEIFICRI